MPQVRSGGNSNQYKELKRTWGCCGKKELRFYPNYFKLGTMMNYKVNEPTLQRY